MTKNNIFLINFLIKSGACAFERGHNSKVFPQPIRTLQLFRMQRKKLPFCCFSGLILPICSHFSKKILLKSCFSFGLGAAMNQLSMKIKDSRRERIRIIEPPMNNLELVSSMTFLSLSGFIEKDQTGF